MSSFDLREELEALLDLQTYSIDNEHNVKDMEAREVDVLLQRAVASVANDFSSITEEDVFDIYRSILKHSNVIHAVLMTKVIDSLSSGLAAAIDATNHDAEQLEQDQLSERKITVEMYGFLLYWFVIAAEKVKKGVDEDAPTATAKPRRARGGKAAAPTRAGKSAARGEWTWQSQIEPILALISKAFRMRTARLWTTTADRDTFIDCMTRPVYRIMENEQYMKVESTRMGVYKAICLAVKHHGHGVGAQTTIMQSLQYYEHLSEAMADCLGILAKEFDHAQLGDEVLREIATKEFNSQDSTGPRAFSRFLVRFAENSPRSVLKQLSLLLNHLDSEAYPMRIAIVEILGILIRELLSLEDQDTAKKQINGLFDHLIDRTLDTSSYVRSKVFQVFARLAELDAKFPRQRLRITHVAADALEDKTATVRKAAISCLVALILKHPYGFIDGGMLSQSLFKEKYENAREELRKAEEAVEKVVNPNAEKDEEDGGEDDEENEEDTEDGVSSPLGKRRKSRKHSTDDDDSMDIDEDEGVSDSDSIMGDDIMDEGEAGSSQRRHKDKGKAKHKKKRKTEVDLSMLTEEQMALAALESDKVLQFKMTRRYYAEGLDFITSIEGAMETIGKLLGSTHKAEVLESMDFFRVAHEYQFDGAEAGIKKMVHLIWKKDDSSTTEDGNVLKGIRQRLLECYRNLYFETVEGLEPKHQVNRIAKNMIELTYDATLAELTSLEEMMRHMMDDGQIHGDVISKLWQVYSSDKQLPKQQRRGAIILLGMLALAKDSIIKNKVDVLLRIGLGTYGKADLILAKYTCVALQRLNGSAKKVKGSLMDNVVRYRMDNVIFKKLQEAIENPCRSRDWFALAEQVVNTIYALGDHPEELANKIIKNLTRRAFTSQPGSAQTAQSASAVSSVRTQTPNPDAMDVDGEPREEEREEGSGSQHALTPQPSAAPGPSQPSAVSSGDAGDAFKLSQLLFVVGHVAIKHIVHLEQIEREWKRQKQEREMADKLAKGTEETESKDGDDIDQVAGNAEDEIGERIHAVRETELLYGSDSLLALFGSLLVNICGSPHKYKDPVLRAAATLSFSKFLCISSKFCEDNHLLLFRILETSKDPNIRSNIVIALGDVAVSFSTIIDESLNQLYRGLSDENLIVKKNTLMVLTHLILNGMIKVKGQLGEMAKCLEDEEPRVSDLAKLFFSELSTKDNAIYNNLPDVISHLSVGEHAVDEETFQNTMRYIFNFIEKEKQAENIVEKLCQRFRLAEASRQWRDMAFCLSLLPFRSEKSLKKLIEGLPFYRDKLHDEGVFLRFQEILTKVKNNKNAKVESDVREFERILDEHRQKGEEDQALEKRVETKKAQAKKRATRRTARTKKQPAAPTANEQEAMDLFQSD